MFSQFRQAVEGFAPQPRRSTDVSTDDQKEPRHPRSQSMETPPGRPTSPLSSGQLAESALSNLRKSLATQRAGVAMNKSTSVPSVISPDKARSKMNLEERLRASLSSVDVTSTSPNPPAASTATPRGGTLSPSSTPLPDSPIIPLSDVQDPPRPSIETLTGDAELPLGQQSGNDLGIAKTTGNSDILEELQVETTRAAGLAVSMDAENDHPPKGNQASPSGTGTGLPPTTNISDSTLEDEGHHLEGTDESDSNETPGSLQEESSSSSGSNTGGDRNASPDANVKALQTRLKELEQRFADVSASFKQLQVEKRTADSILHEFTPLTGIQDATALKEYLQGMGSKIEVFQEQMKRLNGKLETQEDQIEELEEACKLSSASHTSQMDGLRSQLRETEALLKESQKSVATSDETLSQQGKKAEGFKSEIERLNTLVKEEEEKRTKAISLLKSVRQKLVKAEKEKEDASRELTALREKERAEADKELAEKERLSREVEAANAEKEKSLANLRLQFEKDIAGFKERHEKEMSAMRGQFELDAITTKSIHNKEIAAKVSHITTLETSLNNVTRDKNTFFEQLQLRQAETESAQSHLESIQHQNTELRYQLREANDRIILLKEDLNELQREQELRSRESSTSAESVAHLLAATESKYEAKIAELKRINAILEKERNDSEAEWSRKLKERGAETEELKRLLGNSAKSQEKEEELVTELKTELGHKHEEVTSLEHQLAEMIQTYSHLQSAEASAKSLVDDLYSRIDTLEKQTEENKVKDAQLRQTNKALREELRKVQSSVALLERQRNPGVGYWTARVTDNSPGETGPSTPTTGSRVGSPVPEPSNNKNEEEVNLEYLRNVILQFLEHKEMRPNLVRVLSIILHFTPQETRRLMSKV